MRKDIKKMAENINKFKRTTTKYVFHYKNFNINIFPFSNTTNDLIRQLKESLDDSSDSETEIRVPAKKVKNNGKPQKKIINQRFRWKPEMVEALLESMMEVKTQYECNGLDFEADLVRLYTDVQVIMASRFDCGEFGPVSARQIPEDVPSEEL